MTEKNDYFYIKYFSDSKVKEWKRAKEQKIQGWENYNPESIQKLIFKNERKRIFYTAIELIKNINSKNLSVLIERVRYDQKFSIFIFELITKIKLKKTNKEILKQLKSFCE